MIHSELQIRMSVEMQHWARGWICSSPRSSPTSSGERRASAVWGTQHRSESWCSTGQWAPRCRSFRFYTHNFWVMSRYNQWLLALHVIVLSAKGGFFFTVCLCVCLSDWKITQKVINRFWWNFQKLLIMVQGTDGHILKIVPDYHFGLN